MFWILVIVALLLLFYWKGIRHTSYWRNKGVCQSKWVVPFMGDGASHFVSSKAFPDIHDSLYKKFAGKRYAGVYQMNLPVLVVYDPELLKQITVKDFDHFTDHMQFIKEDIDPMWSKNLFALRGDKWRQMRTTLSPAFTGSKMKLMLPLMEESAKQVVQYLSEFQQDVVELEMKDTFTRFCNDVIANCAFGVKCDSLREKENEFYLMGKEVSNFQSSASVIKFLLYLIFPPIAKIIDIKIFSQKVRKFFTGLISTAIELREINNIVRQDMIHLLMEANKGLLKRDEEDPDISDSISNNELHAKAKESLSVEDITAQALIFFLAGFDSVATFMTFLAYEIAVNTDVQERMRSEIEDTIEDHGGRLTYETINSMKYFDMVISETLRKWPPTPATERICTKRYTIKAKEPGERDLTIDVGENIMLPNWPMHYDPKYFPDPHKFDPERFSEERKKEIQPFTYYPFGLGPRICIGSRFALLETKIVFVHLLRKFDFVPVGRTHIPMKLQKGIFNMAAEGGMWVGFLQRK